MTSINLITVFDSDNYIGRFVVHYMKGSVADPDDLVIATGHEDEILKQGGLLVWCSNNPKPSAARRFTVIAQKVKPDSIVVLSTVKVYDVINGENINELTPLNENEPATEAEKIIIGFSESAGIPLAILRLPLLTVGTGMDGVLRDMVNGISRGTYSSIKDVEARVSTMHASDIGQAILMIAGESGKFNINDRTSPTVSVLADALSYRIGKRLFNMSARNARRMARFLSVFGYKHPERMYRFKTTTLTFSAEKFYSRFEMKPVDTVSYLKTHTYDENSL